MIMFFLNLKIGLLLLSLLVFASLNVTAQDIDTVLLKEIEIKSERLSIKESQSLQSIQLVNKHNLSNTSDNEVSSSLKQLSLVDIRQRSFSRSQSDLSTRGGSFDQTMVLLNGINLSDPQTGHHNLNIPITNNVLSGIEVVYGPASRIFGANAFTGAVNFITRIPDENAFSFDISYASFNTMNISVHSDLVLGKFKQSFSADYGQSDGFTDNTDYKTINLYHETNIDLKLFKAKTMIGFMDKGFGSQSFYTPAFPNQYEKIKTGFAALKLTGGNNLRWDYKLYYRGLKDQFQLFREGAGYYANTNGLWINNTQSDTITWYSGHNNHFTSVLGSGLDFSGKWIAGETSIGIDYRYEQIFSNVLGLDLDEIALDLYTKSDLRQNVSVFANHAYYYKDLLVNIGGMAFWNQKYDWNYYYGADFGYYITKELLLKVGLNKSLRLPTFTDLYYQGPSNIGNPNLVPESALSLESGVRYYIKNYSYFSLNVFARNGKDIISWVRASDSDIWKTENLTELNTLGIEFTSMYRDFNKTFFLNSVSLSYAYIYQDKSATGLDSKYTLDHLKHKMILNANHKVLKNISAAWSLNVFERNGEFMLYDRELLSYAEPVEYDLTALLNLKITADFKKLIVYTSIYNITNADYFDIGNVPTPGISVMFGLKLNL